MLKRLCDLNSTSGDENEVRNFIIDHIKDYCDYSVDALGSIIAFKKGKSTPKNKVMICAHMDEVGFIITNVNEDGTLSFDTVGGINSNVIPDRNVIVNNIDGVIGLKPIHMLDDKEKNSPPSVKSLRIDIGAQNKEEALQYVNLGDYAYFKNDYAEIGNGFVKSKALDDRIGCLLMIELIKSDLQYDTYFCFNVQEEVGLRGSACTSYQVNSDIAIVLEATTAADLCGVIGGERVCVLGNGPVVSFMDNRTIYSKELYNLAFSVAKDNDIKIQTKTAIAGGNDAGSIQTSCGGCKVLAISLPCRYIHSASSVAKIDDIDAMRKLLANLLPKLYI